MIRLEIISTQAVQADLLERLAVKELIAHYTIFPVAHGSGLSGQRMGDAVWPEENFVLISFCSREEAVAVRKIVDEVRTLFPEEGVFCSATAIISLEDDEQETTP